MALTVTAKPASTKQTGWIRDMAAEKIGWQDNVAGDVAETILDILGNVGNPDPKFITSLEASRAIGALLAYKPAKTAPVPGAGVSVFTRLQTVLAALKPGYYALPREDVEDTYDFYRVVEVENGPWKGRRFVNRLLGAPGGWNKVKPTVAQQLPIAKLIARDWQAAAKAYAAKHQKCARCNADLSNPRSQVALVGEHCAGEWGWPW